MALLIVLALLGVVTLAAGAAVACRRVPAGLRRTRNCGECVGMAPPHPPEPAVVSPRAAVEFDSDNELAEIVLAASRLGGHLPTAVYQGAMAALAAQDETRQPVMVPPEPGP